MMRDEETAGGRQAVAFAGRRRIAVGPLIEVARQAKAALDLGETAPIAVFDRVTSEPIDLDWRGDADDVAARLRAGAIETSARSRGRPKLGVTAREVTLLPRHWSWLGAQPGGASAALRRLVEQARQTHRAADALREARQAAYRFVTAMAGDEPSYEEAIRALFAGDRRRFTALISRWPADVRDHAQTLAAGGFGPPPPALDEAWMPVDREGEVRAALSAAFGAAAIRSVQPLPSGASGAGLWKIEVEDAAFVLRLDPPPDAFRDPSRHVACLEIAAAYGLAPPLVFANAGAGLSISAFIAGSPAAPPLTRRQRLARLSEAVARLHAAPLFPAHGDYFDAVTGLLTSVGGLGVLPRPMATSALEGLARVARACPDVPGERVASHNDLNPSNVIFQGDRPFIVDWESAFAAPRYVDLAALATFQATDEAEAAFILERYHQTPPSGPQSARFWLMRQVNRLFYAAMLLTAAAGERSTALSPDAVRRHQLEALRGDMASLGAYEGRLAFGCAFFNQAMEAFAADRFEAALTEV